MYYCDKERLISIEIRDLRLINLPYGMQYFFKIDEKWDTSQIHQAIIKNAIKEIHSNESFKILIKIK